MGLKVTNNAFGTLNAGINSSATTIVLAAGQGARFPSLGAGDYFYATLIDTSNNLEIVKVTARSTDTMTVVRGQDGTTARAYSTNDRFELRPTAVMFTETIDKADAAVRRNGDSLTGLLTGITNSSSLASNAYSTQTGFQAYAATSPADAYAGYGFHKAGTYGTFLYARNTRTLALRGDDGTDTTLLTDYNNDTNSGRILRRSSGSDTRLEERIFGVTLPANQSWVELFRWNVGSSYATAIGEIFAVTNDWGCHGAAANNSNFHLSAQASGSYADRPGQIRTIYRSSSSNDGISFRINAVSLTDLRFEARIQDDGGGGIDCSSAANTRFYVKIFVVDSSLTWNYT